MIRINLALQGGGAHGAFTWGALDRLLAERDIEIAAISGTSAGAMNAAVLKAGLVRGGRDAARANLEWFWGRIGAVTDARWSDWISALAPTAPAMARAIEWSPAFRALEAATRMMSPYAYGPMLRNPLARVLGEIRFEDVRDPAGPRLFVGATNVRSGKIRVFTGDELTAEAVLASACLPTLFRAVEIDDPATGRREAYWDGGYTGNPALFPLYDKDLPDDVVIVNINPLHRDEVPGDSLAIQNRINEISFNSSLLRELRAVDFVRRLLADHRLPEGAMKRVLVHMVGDDALMNDLNVATKTIPAPVILARLRAAGEMAMDRFLRDHKADLGRRDTVDLRKMFS
ncbi:patatin-like phospholipase family protein [Limimaricola pyoseonensis]|uniref:NTE family protein n=1 Tax=Limimaricola pyoseonensis TaxID=521013 RepID=A0A1G7ABR4_9RHOB|nr:patatin-like phospholipase family protein [Limimaricola pyoseonensis]SDE11495.1 NTE family protein [Limimaricola pyoseonensis]